MVLTNPAVNAVWATWDDLQLPDCWLVAGCVAQTTWNVLFGLPPEHGISDIDLVYFDGGDLTPESEQAEAERVSALLPEIRTRIDIKNEARVHLWYEEKFGTQIRPYVSTVDAIATFPTTATAIGIRPTNSGPEIFAPFGVADLLTGVVRPNKRQITQDIYEAKVSRLLAHWPELCVIGWSET